MAQNIITEISVEKPQDLVLGGNDLTELKTYNYDLSKLPDPHIETDAKAFRLKVTPPTIVVTGLADNPKLTLQFTAAHEQPGPYLTVPFYQTLGGQGNALTAVRDTILYFQALNEVNSGDGDLNLLSIWDQTRADSHQLITQGLLSFLSEKGYNTELENAKHTSGALRSILTGMIRAGAKNQEQVPQWLSEKAL